MIGKVIKEVFIFALLVAVVIGTILMVFYDFFNNTRELPEVKQYIASSEIKATLEEIEASKEEKLDSESLLKSYEIVKADLKIYQNDGSYEKGNANPFEAYTTRAKKEYEKAFGDSNTTSNNGTSSSGTTSSNTTSTNTSSSTSSSNSSSTSNSNNSNSSSQGTLFEEPNSK